MPSPRSWPGATRSRIKASCAAAPDIQEKYIAGGREKQGRTNLRDHRTLQTGADNIGKVSIKVENEAGGKQKQEQGVRGKSTIFFNCTLPLIRALYQ